VTKGDKADCVLRAGAAGSGFEEVPWEAGLANDGKKGANSYFVVIRNDDGCRAGRVSFLHYNVASFAPGFRESVAGEQPADFLAGEDAETTQP
jgi:hypothetical protein